jgi:predicted lipoprotein with Yx(FWY)xxD motif
MMTLQRSVTRFGGVAVAPIVVLGVVACGTPANNTSGSGTPAPSKSGTSGGGTAATVGVATSGSLGTILVDAQGRTVYLFQADTGRTSTCNGACATAWPPVTVTGTPTVGGNANAALVGTTARSDGSMQVTYNGHPLYRYIGDSSAGSTSGQGVNAFGALWYVVNPSGNQVTSASSSSSSSSSNSLGY